MWQAHFVIDCKSVSHWGILCLQRSIRHIYIDSLITKKQKHMGDWNTKNTEKTHLDLPIAYIKLIVYKGKYKILMDTCMLLLSGNAIFKCCVHVSLEHI